MNHALTRRLLAVFVPLLFLSCPGVNWFETYDREGTQPFDLYALYELLEARPEGVVLLEDTTDLLLLDTVTGGNYVFVGLYPYYEEEGVTRLLDFVERGNTAFISANVLPEDLAYHLFGDACYYERFEDQPYGNGRFPTVQVDSVTAYRYPGGDTFPLVNVFNWEPRFTELYTVNDQLLCDPEFDQSVLGSLDTFGINFLRLGWGRGDFYFHSTPRYLTNWYVLDSLAYRYPESVLSVVGSGPIYWDEAHRRYTRDPLASNNSSAGRNYTGGRNLLNGNQTLLYIQERRELALAWYILLAGALLFVISRGRRRQRVIPVLPIRDNSSQRLIETVSRLVHEKGNHAALAQREMASLRFHLNHHRGVRWREGSELPDDLGERLGLSEEEMKRARAQIRLVERAGKLQEGDLIRFFRAIEPLYRR